jgi:hypothetical protein
VGCLMVWQSRSREVSFGEAWLGSQGTARIFLEGLGNEWSGSPG